MTIHITKKGISTILLIVAVVLLIVSLEFKVNLLQLTFLAVWLGIVFGFKS